jgi:predicted aconitase
MMKLTVEEESMLAGKRGYPIQKSMEILVQLGEIYGAQKMIKISSVHMPGASRERRARNSSRRWPASKGNSAYSLR